MTIQQLVVDLENEPGRLYLVTEALGRAAVSIHSLVLCDGATSGTVRMLVSDIRRARETVMELDLPARTEEALVLVLPDSYGSLAEMLEPIYDEYVNVLQMNAFSEIDGRAVAVIRFSDNKLAEGILREHGHEPLSLASLFPPSEEEE